MVLPIKIQAREKPNVTITLYQNRYHPHGGFRIDVSHLHPRYRYGKKTPFVSTRFVLSYKRSKSTDILLHLFFLTIWEHNKVTGEKIGRHIRKNNDTSFC